MLEDEISKLKQELNAAEKKLREREEEFEQFKQQLNLKPEVRLQAQINVLTLEKVLAIIRRWNVVLLLMRLIVLT